MRWTRIQRLYFWVTSLVLGVVVGMLTSTFQFVAQFYGMGEINPESNDFEPAGPLSIAMFVVALANMCDPLGESSGQPQADAKL